MTDKAACLQELWDCLYLEHPLREADAIIGFGSYDLSVPARAAWLYQEGWAPLILFTGYLGKGTAGVFHKPEAEIFADIAIKLGVPAEAILVEDRAGNTGENIRFSRSLLEDIGPPPKTIIAVHKPYMARRVWAALQQQWPEVDVIIAPGNPSLSDHLAGRMADGVEESEIINSLVGDFQRMEVYTELGWQIPQDLPATAKASYEALVKMGYDRYVLKD